MSKPMLQAGDQVRVFSAAGPCLPATVVKVNRTRYRLDFYGTRLDEPFRRVHLASEPCPSCAGRHPGGSYPDSYQH